MKSGRLKGITKVIFICIFAISICSISPTNVQANSGGKGVNILVANSTSEEIFYRVIVGSFKNISNAKKMVTTMEGLGLDVFISEENINGQNLNRVVVGSFSQRKNAESMVSDLEDMGYDAFIDTFIKYSDKDNSSINNSNDKTIYYAVIAGSFNNIENANERLKELQDDGFECYISTDLIDGKVYNRIITGSFTNKKNAQNKVNELVKEGYEAFIDVYEENNKVTSPNKKETTYYTVVVGSFKEYKNAENIVHELNEKGIDSYVSPTNINGEIINRVIAGSFINKENANNMINTLKLNGYEAFIDVYIQ